jgi:hypothetical protein
MIELTAAQARSVGELAEREGTLSLHQLPDNDPAHPAGSVYATPRGTHRGFRIAPDGALSEIGDTLPAAGGL